MSRFPLIRHLRLTVLLMHLPGVLLAQEIAVPPGELSIQSAERSARVFADEVAIREAAYRAALADLAGVKAAAGTSFTVVTNAALLSNPPDGVEIPVGAFGSALPAEPVVLAEAAGAAQYSLTATMSLPLVTWGRLAALADAAQAAVSLRQVEVDASRAAAARDTHAAYFATLSAQRSLDLLQAAVQELRQVRSDTRGALQEGLITTLELLDVEAQLAAVLRQEAGASQAVATGMLTIALLTGQDPDTRLRLTSEFRDAPLALPGDMAAAARQASLQRRSLVQQIQQAASSLRAQRAEQPFRPTLAAAVQVEVRGDKLPVSSDWSDGWSTGVTLSLRSQTTVLDGGAARARQAAAEANLAGAQAGLQQLDRLLVLEVRRAQEALANAQAASGDRAAAAAAAAEIYRTALVAFENQLATRRAVAGARVQLLSRQLERVAAGREVEMAAAGIERLLGLR